MSNMDHSNSWDDDGVDDHESPGRIYPRGWSPFMRDYSTTGFYLAKFDEIGYQVCPSSSIVKYEQSQKYWCFFWKKCTFHFFPSSENVTWVGRICPRLLARGWSSQVETVSPVMSNYYEHPIWKRTPGTRRLIMWARSSLCHYGNSCSQSL